MKKLILALAGSVSEMYEDQEGSARYLRLNSEACGHNLGFPRGGWEGYPVNGERKTEIREPKIV